MTPADTLSGAGFEVTSGEGYVTPDERDVDMIAGYLAAFGPAAGIDVGDFVEYPSGELRRVSHVWRDEHGATFSVQTSICGASGDVGSFYLGAGHLSYSGGLERGADPSSFKPTGRTRSGACWTFHHGRHQAHNAVYLQADRRVWVYVGGAS